jgi:hypothetical protein
MQKSLVSDERLNRISVPKILCLCSPFMEASQFESVIRFLVTEACLDLNEEVRAEAHKAAITLIKTKGPSEASALLAIIEKFLEGVEPISDEPLKQLREPTQSAQN